MPTGGRAHLFPFSVSKLQKHSSFRQLHIAWNQMLRRSFNSRVSTVFSQLLPGFGTLSLAKINVKITFEKCKVQCETRWPRWFVEMKRKQLQQVSGPKFCTSSFFINDRFLIYRFLSIRLIRTQQTVSLLIDRYLTQGQVHGRVLRAELVWHVSASKL